MNYLVKIIKTEDGESQVNPKWHLVNNEGGSNRAVCTGEVYGLGEGSAEFKLKNTERGGVTCSDCIEIIKWFKSVKL